MTPQQFVAKWSKIQLKEITTAQSHFLDICQLIGHPAPLDADPQGEFFTFEAPTANVGGNQGRADVWYKGKMCHRGRSLIWPVRFGRYPNLLYKVVLNPLLIKAENLWPKPTTTKNP